MFVLCMTGVREGRAVCSLREFAMTLPPVLVLDFCPGRRRPKAAKNGEAGGEARVSSPFYIAEVCVSIYVCCVCISFLHLTYCVVVTVFVFVASVVSGVLRDVCCRLVNVVIVEAVVVEVVSSSSST